MRARGDEAAQRVSEQGRYGALDADVVVVVVVRVDVVVHFDGDRDVDGDDLH
jgi:hypothetical protein